MTAAILGPPPIDPQPDRAADVVPLHPRKGHRLAFMNNKGGVGKTTMCREIAAALARMSYRILLVDMDAQGNLTRRTGVTVTDGQHTVYDVLTNATKGGIEQAIVPCGWDIPEAAYIDVAPSDLRLDDYIHRAHEAGFDMRLKRVLYGVTDHYDYTLIDCHSTLGALEQMTVGALDDEHDGVYIPIEPGHDAISGASRAIDRIDYWAEQFDTGHRVLGILVNQVRENTNLHQARVSQLAPSLHQEDRPDVPILSPHIPLVVHLAQAQDQAQAATTDPRLNRDVLDEQGTLIKAGIVTRFDQLAKAIDIRGRQ